mmetsp:Transcript_30041/g.45398  ORF Transcript_30041/g.45398 Transcript_30041/m.45398 type:complete len:226 (-) Transcript_30041:145-822(-)
MWSKDGNNRDSSPANNGTLPRIVFPQSPLKSMQPLTASNWIEAAMPTCTAPYEKATNAHALTPFLTSFADGVMNHSGTPTPFLASFLSSDISGKPGTHCTQESTILQANSSPATIQMGDLMASNQCSTSPAKPLTSGASTGADGTDRASRKRNDLREAHLMDGGTFPRPDKTSGEVKPPSTGQPTSSARPLASTSSGGHAASDSQNLPGAIPKGRQMANSPPSPG